MLTTSRASRRRLAAGAASVSLLIAGGLGLTASSSQAAEAIKASVGEALQAAPPAAPLPPAAVPATEPQVAPPVPPRPEAATTSRTRKRVVIVKDGKTTTYEGADADRYIADNGIPTPPAPPAVAGAPQPRVMVMRRGPGDRNGPAPAWIVDMPEISNANCPGDAARPVVENSVKDGKHRIVICTNRMAAMTRDAERMASNGDMMARNARVSARSSLAMARAAIERDRNLTDDQRRDALAGIADAEAELKDDAKD